jgi:hypothetical protein
MKTGLALLSACFATFFPPSTWQLVIFLDGGYSVSLVLEREE